MLKKIKMQDLRLFQQHCWGIWLLWDVTWFGRVASDVLKAHIAFI